jgi:hypothetical protein
MINLQLDFRMELKLQLLMEGNGKVPLCPFCQHRLPGGITHPASQMHEIVCPQIKGGKYHPDPESPLAAAVYVLENLILACAACNVEWLNSQDKGWVLGVKLQQPGYSVERVIPKILDIARCLKYSSGVVPRSIPLPTGSVTIDLKNYTYTLEE